MMREEVKTTFEFPIDVTTAEGELAIRYLLGKGYSTPEQICDVVDGVSLIEDCVILDASPWIADDGNAEEEYRYNDYAARESAEAYVEGGDWGTDLDGSVRVNVWRVAIDADGDDCDVEEEAFDIDLVNVLDHSSAIRDAMWDGSCCSGDEGCGSDPDDHDWTSAGEGGLDENPGVWSTGGTSMVFKSHCRQCGLHRTESHCGSQRNPGEGDAVSYRLLDADEVARHRANGTMTDTD